MSHHGVMRMEDLRPEDFDDIDESTLEVLEPHEVTMILSVPLRSPEFELLSDIAKRDGRTIIEAAQDAIREYVEARAPGGATRRRAS